MGIWEGQKNCTAQYEVDEVDGCHGAFALAETATVSRFPKRAIWLIGVVAVALNWLGNPE
jgi:hypothetical protein